jgi:hypothetical protein
VLCGERWRENKDLKITPVQSDQKALGVTRKQEKAPWLPLSPHAGLASLEYRRRQQPGKMVYEQEARVLSKVEDLGLEPSLRRSDI